MKFNLRKFLGAMAVAIPMTIVAVPPTAVDDLNLAVSDLLKDFNNEKTLAKLIFTNLEVNPQRALKAGFVAMYNKKGGVASLGLSINELEYDYNAKAGPSVTFDGTMNTDMVAVFGRQTLNEMGPEVHEIMAEFANEFVNDYGPAATVQTKLLREQYSANGDLMSIAVSLKGDVDLSKLPVGVSQDSVPVTQVNLKLRFGLLGVGISGKTVMNPRYKGFRADQEGLKELVEALLAKDPDTMDRLREGILILDSLVGSAVEGGFKD